MKINSLRLFPAYQEGGYLNYYIPPTETTSLAVKKPIIQEISPKFVEYPRQEIDIEPLYEKYAEFEEYVSRPETRRKFYKKYYSSNKKEIKKIQRFLIANGFDLPKHGVDGFWGDETDMAYKQYLIKRSKEVIDIRDPREIVCNWGKCAEYVSNVLGGSVGGRAWWMLNDIISRGGKPKYNLYDRYREAFNKVEINKSVKELKRVTTESIKKDRLKKVIKPSILSVGDVVGIFNPLSNYHKIALEEGHRTFNTHVGVVTSINEKGIPIISHNMLGKAYHQPYNLLDIVWIGTPAENIVNTVFDDSNKPPKGSFYKDYINYYVEQMADFLGYVNDKEQVKRDIYGILQAESMGGKVIPGEVELKLRSIAKQLLGSDPTGEVSSGPFKIKISNFSLPERNFLNINEKKLEEPDSATKAAVYLYFKHYNMFDDYRRRNPHLGLTDKDVRNMTILSYNQGVERLKKLGYLTTDKSFKEEINTLRKLETEPVYDPTSYWIGHVPWIGEELYKMKLYRKGTPKGHESYISKVNRFGNKFAYGGNIRLFPMYQEGGYLSDKHLESLKPIDIPEALKERNKWFSYMKYATGVYKNKYKIKPEDIKEIKEYVINNIWNAYRRDFSGIKDERKRKLAEKIFELNKENIRYYLPTMYKPFFQFGGDMRLFDKNFLCPECNSFSFYRGKGLPKYQHGGEIILPKSFVPAPTPPPIPVMRPDYRSPELRKKLREELFEERPDIALQAAWAGENVPWEIMGYSLLRWGIPFALELFNPFKKIKAGWKFTKGALGPVARKYLLSPTAIKAYKEFGYMSPFILSYLYRTGVLEGSSPDVEKAFEGFKKRQEMKEGVRKTKSGVQEYGGKLPRRLRKFIKEEGGKISETKKKSDMPEWLPYTVFIPPAYNLMKTIFSKPIGFQIPTIAPVSAPIKYPLEAELQAIRSSKREQENKLRSVSGGDAGMYLAGMAQIDARARLAEQRAREKAYRYDLAAEEAWKAQDLQRRMAIAQYEWQKPQLEAQMEAARMAALSKAFEQVPESVVDYYRLKKGILPDTSNEEWTKRLQDLLEKESDKT